MEGRSVAGRFRVRRFDADRKDRELTLEGALESKQSERQLLWIDVVGTIEPDKLAAIGKRFKLVPQAQAAHARPIERPHVEVYGSHLHVSVAADAPGSDATTPPWLDVVGGELVVITRHESPLAVLDRIDERITADATLGAAEGGEFVAMLLDGVITRWFEADDAIEDEIDRLDSRSLQDDGRRQLLDDLVALRRRIARLRRTVAAHRTVFSALGGPEIRQVTKSSDAAADLQATARRYDAVVGSVEATREALLGSFDVYMTRTAQRTNDIVKILTIATVLLLPGSVVAGFLGMNVIVPLNKDDPISFWLVVGAVVLLAVVVLGAARLKRWI